MSTYDPFKNPTSIFFDVQNNNINKNDKIENISTNNENNIFLKVSNNEQEKKTITFGISNALNNKEDPSKNNKKIKSVLFEDIQTDVDKNKITKSLFQSNDIKTNDVNTENNDKQNEIKKNLFDGVLNKKDKDNTEKIINNTVPKTKNNTVELDTIFKELSITPNLIPNTKQENISPFYDESNKSKIFWSKFRDNPLINFTIIFESENPEIKINNNSIKVKFKIKDQINNLIRLIKNRIQKIYNTKYNEKIFEYTLYKNTKKEKILNINKNDLIEDYIKNNDTIIVLLLQKQETDDNIKKDEQQIKKEELCELTDLPILEKEGYHLSPDISLLCRMTKNELKNINNFAIYNKFGKIKFNVPVSVYKVNFNPIFTIEQGNIKYEENKLFHSKRGENFNVPATIILYNVFKSNVIDLNIISEKKEFENLLKEKCKKFNGNFISYDYETNQLVFEVPYFD